MIDRLVNGKERRPHGLFQSRRSMAEVADPYGRELSIKVFLAPGRPHQAHPPNETETGGLFFQYTTPGLAVADGEFLWAMTGG